MNQFGVYFCLSQAQKGNWELFQETNCSCWREVVPSRASDSFTSLVLKSFVTGAGNSLSLEAGAGPSTQGCGACGTRWHRLSWGHMATAAGPEPPPSCSPLAHPCEIIWAFLAWESPLGGWQHPMGSASLAVLGCSWAAVAAGQGWQGGF